MRTDGRRMMKELAKRVARPVTGRLFARVDARVAPISKHVDEVTRQIDPLVGDVAAIRERFAPAMARVQTHDKLTAEHSAAIREMSEQLGALNSYLPVVLNNLSSQNAAQRELRRAELELRDLYNDINARLPGPNEVADLRSRIEELGSVLADRIAAVEQRAEFLRREVLFEARYGARGQGVQGVVDPRIVSEEKVVEAGEDLRLNLGCGHIPLEGFLNVDARPLDGVDVVAEVGDLPFDPGTVAHIHSMHLLEHFPVEELSRRLLPYWFDMLRPGGTFTAVVPDSETMLDEYAAGRFPFDDLRLVIFGEQEYDGDFHFNMFSRTSLCELIEKAGFADVHIVEAGRRNGVCYEMEVAALRPDDHA
jgi:hypothetical protein